MIITTNKTICVIDGKENSLIFFIQVYFFRGCLIPVDLQHEMHSKQW